MIKSKLCLLIASMLLFHTTKNVSHDTPEPTLIWLCRQRVLDSLCKLFGQLTRHQETCIPLRTEWINHREIPIYNFSVFFGLGNYEDFPTNLDFTEHTTAFKQYIDASNKELTGEELTGAIQHIVNLMVKITQECEVIKLILEEEERQQREILIHLVDSPEQKYAQFDMLVSLLYKTIYQLLRELSQIPAMKIV